MKSVCIAGCLLLFACFGCDAQEYHLPETRPEELVSNDTLYRFSVLLNRPVRVCLTSRFYYWFAKERIIRSQGAWDGKLLDGEFRVLLKGGQLMRAGWFREGVKQGEWKFWREDGTLVKIERWREGVLHGRVLQVVNDSVVQRTKFRRGQMVRSDRVKTKRDGEGKVLYQGKSVF